MSHDEPNENAIPRLSAAHQNVLAEPVLFLESHCDELVRKWTELYLSTFGRKSFFSPERVRSLFEEMADTFILSLKRRDFAPYFAMLRERGKLFSSLGVPFEEVVLCLQLFENAYVSLILDNKKIVKHGVEEILVAFEELHRASAALFALSYFTTVKNDWQNACRGYQEENERLRHEIETLHDDVLASTKNELASMQLLIGSMNRRLRRSVVRSRRVQMFSELLEKESNLKNLLRIADKFLRQMLPPGSHAIYGLFDENQRKLSLHASASAEPGDAPLAVFDEIYFSQMPLDYQEALFNDGKTHVAPPDAKSLPSFLASTPRVADAKDFLFLPLKKYHDSLGFLFLSSPEKDVFAKPAIKYYLRLARVFSQALFGLVYFNRHKKHGEFISILDRLDEHVLQRNPLETTLDYCLGAMIELLDVERASLMMLEKKQRTLSIYAAKGYKVYPFSGLTLKWGEGIAGWSIKESKIISIPRLRGDRGAAFVPSKNGSQDAPQLGVQSLLCVPLISRGEPIGVINLSTLSYHKNFEQSEIDMIHQFAQRISTALTSLATIKDFEAVMKPYL